MKKYLFWLLVMSLLGFVGGRYYAHRSILSRISYDLPITTHSISVEPNCYGSYLAGFLAQQKQSYADSITFFSQALQKDPQNQNLKITLYLLRIMQGDINGALPLAQDLASLKKPELLADYLLFSQAIKSGNYQAAEKILATKPSYGADTMLSPLLKAWVRVGQGKQKEAYQALRPLKNDKKTTAFYHYYRALISLAFNDTKSAKSSFEQMSKLSTKGYPTLTAVLFLRDFYQKQGLWGKGQVDYDRLDKALESVSSLQQIVKETSAPAITPQLGIALSFYDISVLLAPLKIQETCLVFNELSLYLTPEAIMPKIWGGELMESSGNYIAANQIYDRVQNPNDLILLKKTVNYISAEEYSQALHILEDLLSRNQDDALLFVLMGDVQSNLEHYESSLKYYQTAQKLFHKNQQKTEESQILLAIANVYEQLKQKDKVEESLLQSLKLNPNDPLTLNYLGYVWLERNHNIDEAFKMVQKALDLSPEDANIMDSVALGYYMKHDYVKALELAEKATDQLSFSSVAYQHLGDIYAALNRTREAKYQYQKALNLTNDLTPELQADLEQKLNALTGQKRTKSK